MVVTTVVTNLLEKLGYYLTIFYNAQRLSKWKWQQPQYL